MTACAKWHPDEPGVFYSRKRISKRTGVQNEHIQCRLCQRQRWQHRKDQYFHPGKPYGVLPALKWAPPEL